MDISRVNQFRLGKNGQRIIGGDPMELIEQLLTNGNELTFSVLFIVILGYVIKTNDKRELKYQETIDKNQQIISDTVQALNGFEDLKQDVQKIAEKVGA